MLLLLWLPQQPPTGLCCHSQGCQCPLDHSLTPQPPNSPSNRPRLLTASGLLEHPCPFLLIQSPNRHLSSCTPSPSLKPHKESQSSMFVCTHWGSPNCKWVKSCPRIVARKMSCWHLQLESGTHFPIKAIIIDDFRFCSTIRTIVQLRCWLNRHLEAALGT